MSIIDKLVSSIADRVVVEVSKQLILISEDIYSKLESSMNSFIEVAVTELKQSLDKNKDGQINLSDVI